jgi:hypothetical protein
MSTKVFSVLVGVVVGAIAGSAGGYIAGVSPVSMAVCASIGAVLGGVIALIPLTTLLGWLGVSLLEGLGEGLLGCLFEVLLNSCLSFAFLLIVSIVTVAGFLRWHSVLLAALAGGNIIMLIGLSLVAALYKAGSQFS